jgi:hypothetical protein
VFAGRKLFAGFHPEVDQETVTLTAMARRTEKRGKNLFGFRQGKIREKAVSEKVVVKTRSVALQKPTENDDDRYDGDESDDALCGIRHIKTISGDASERLTTPSSATAERGAVAAKVERRRRLRT